MISVVCWLWAPPPQYRSSFDWSHVQLLQRQVARHYPHPHRVVCVTNVSGRADGVEAIPDREDFASLPSPHGRSNPSCYRRLRLFDPSCDFGSRIVSLDLDVVITGDLTPLWDRPEDLVLYRDPGPKRGYCGSMILLTAGCRPQVWERFDAMTSPQQALVAGRSGSDQGWITHVLGPDEAVWTPTDGVYSYRYHIAPTGALPADARLVVCHGAQADPWLPHMRRHEWVARAYC